VIVKVTNVPPASLSPTYLGGSISPPCVISPELSVVGRVEGELGASYELG